MPLAFQSLVNTEEEAMMQRVVTFALVLALGLIPTLGAEAAPANDVESRIKVKRVKMVRANSKTLCCNAFAVTKVLLELAITPRAKMLSAALEGMAVPLTDSSHQQMARPPAPRLVALAPPPPREAPLPTTFEPR